METRAAQVKATFRLGSEVHSVNAAPSGSVSEQLFSMKEASMAVLKDYITKNNAPTDVPDDLPEEASSDDDMVGSDKTQVKSKKSKLN